MRILLFRPPLSTVGGGEGYLHCNDNYNFFTGCCIVSRISVDFVESPTNLESITRVLYNLCKISQRIFQCQVKNVESAPFFVTNASSRLLWKLSHCRFHDVVGIEPSALGGPSDGRIHSEQVGHFHGTLEFARGPSEGKVGVGMKDLLSGLKDL